MMYFIDCNIQDPQPTKKYLYLWKFGVALDLCPMIDFKFAQQVVIFDNSTFSNFIESQIHLKVSVSHMSQDFVILGSLYNSI